MNARIDVLPDADAVARRAADMMTSRISDARRLGAAVHIALSGGTTPKRAYELLGDMQGAWSHVHLWLADERCVPTDHPDSNARMIDETLLSSLRAFDGPHLHPVRGELEPEDAAWLYGRELVATMGERPVFDLVLLGMGPDGHTASLFPGRPEATAHEAPVIGVRGAPKPPPERISLTLPVLRDARFTLLLVTGEEKRDALERLRAGDEDLPPARLGDGLDEVLCDPAAAGAARG
jgi:6-phosphogluconolactonase